MMNMGEVVNELEKICKMENGARYAVMELYAKIQRSCRNYYITFGNSDDFPYQDTYLIVKADDWKDAIRKIRGKYGTRFSFCYGERIWNDNRIGEKYYQGQNPAEIIW